MGDENSMAGQTKAHKHSAVSSDGGFLETTVTGVTNLSTGSIVYGDASEIVTELTAGSEGDSLKISSGVPAWATGSAGASGWEFVEEFVNPSKQVNFTCSLASTISLVDYVVLVQWWLKNEDISSNMEIKINTESGYYINGGASSGLTVSGGIQIPANSWCIGNLIYYGNTQDSERTMGFMDATHGSEAGGETFGIRYQPSFCINAGVTSISQIQFFPTNGDQYADNYCRVYKMATS